LLEDMEGDPPFSRRGLSGDCDCVGGFNVGYDCVEVGEGDVVARADDVVNANEGGASDPRFQVVNANEVS
jgi:hypothetical protein